MGVLDIGESMQYVPERGKLAEGAGNDRRELLPFHPRDVGVEKAAVEIHLPPRGKVAIDDGSGEDYDIGRLHPVVDELDESVLSGEHTLVRLATTETPLAARFDIDFVQIDHVDLSAERIPQPGDHSGEVGLFRPRVVKKDHPLVARIDLLGDRGRFVFEIDGAQWRKSPRYRQAALNRLFQGGNEVAKRLTRVLMGQVRTFPR